jgi:hypothetical protein
MGNGTMNAGPYGFRAKQASAFKFGSNCPATATSPYGQAGLRAAGMMSLPMIDEALEEAFQAVMAWMLPSKRYFPNVQKS